MASITTLGCSLLLTALIWQASPALAQEPASESSLKSGSKIISNQIRQFRTLSLEGRYNDAEICGNELLEMASLVDDGGKFLGHIQLEMSMVYLQQKQYDKAEKLLLSSVSNLEKSPTNHDLVSDIYVRLTELYLLNGNLASAEEYNKKAMASYENETPKRPDKIARCMEYTATISHTKGNLKLSLEQLQQALSLVADDPKQARLQAELMSIMARLNGEAGNIDLSYKLNKEAVRQAELVHDPFNPVMAQYLTNLAYSAIQLRSWSEAASYIDRALDIEKSYHKEDSALTQRLLSLRSLVSSHLESTSTKAEPAKAVKP